MVACVAPAGFLAERPVHGGALGRAVLDSDHASRAQQPPGGALDGADRIQPVGPAPQSGRRIVFSHLRRHRCAQWDVGRVTDHQIGLAGQLTEGAGGGDTGPREVSPGEVRPGEVSPGEVSPVQRHPAPGVGGG